jgi:hypothetical protein
MPVWVLVTLVSIGFSGFIALLIWIINRIIGQNDDKNNNQDLSIERIIQAVTAIKETTLIQTEILKKHEEYHDDHKERIDKILEYIGKTIKR